MSAPESIGVFFLAFLNVRFGVIFDVLLMLILLPVGSTDDVGRLLWSG